MADVTAARLVIPVTTNADKTEKTFTDLNKTLRSLNGTLNKTGKVATVTSKQVTKAGKAFRLLKSALPFAGLASIVLLFRKTIAVTVEQQKVEAQLNAVLKSTGQQAGLTADQLKNMASGLQSVTNFGDEAIIQAQSLLLTFTKIGSDVFPQATETILNMAEAMGTDLKTQAIQVGKALNDPILGVTALRRVGVQLTDQQTELIKSFVNTGQTAKAQGVILSELQTQFGGVARASRKTLGGALKSLSNTAGDALESIGSGFTPALIDLTNALGDAFSKGGALTEVLNVLGFVSKKTIQVITVLIRGISVLKAVVKDLSDEFSGLDEGEDALNIIAREISKKQGQSETQKAIEELTQSTKNLVGLNDELVGSNNKTASGFRRVTQSAQEANVATEDSIKTQAQALDILSKAGDPTAFLQTQRDAFAEQKRIVAQAGLDVANLEKFQQQQRITQFDNFFKRVVNNQLLSFEERRLLLEENLASVLELENLTNQERLAAQQAFNQQSAALEQQRAQALASSVQFGANILGDFNQIANNLSQVRQNQIQDEINALQEQGASEEEIEKKRRQLARKAALQQRKFATYAAILDTAVAITKALASTKPPASYALAAISAAKGATQIAAIRSQPIPKAQFGGVFEIPPGNEADTGLLRVNQGEQVEITPTGQAGGNNLNEKMILMIGDQEFEGFLVDKTQRILNSGKVTIERAGVVRTA